MARLHKNNKLSKSTLNSVRKGLLSWYDTHHRPMPWRAPPGHRPDPYHEWLSEIMLQQTTVAAVIPYFLNFIERWPNIHALANAKSDDVMHQWAGLGYYARARNLHACAKIISYERGGTFPDTIAELKKLPGIGDYTAAAITSIAFNKPATVVDGNVERVMARYFAVTKPLASVKTELRQLARPFYEDGNNRPGDLAQAFMELGATICVPVKPRCDKCPIARHCAARLKGLTAEIPAAKIKKRRPVRYGYVYWVEDAKGRVLLHKRPAKGLLGGMMGLPTSEWTFSKDELKPLGFIKTHRSSNSSKTAKPLVKHVFSHFDLHLFGIKAKASAKIPDAYIWEKTAAITPTVFPSVFRKSFNAFKDYD